MTCKSCSPVLVCRFTAVAELILCLRRLLHKLQEQNRKYKHPDLSVHLEQTQKFAVTLLTNLLTKSVTRTTRENKNWWKSPDSNQCPFGSVSQRPYRWETACNGQYTTATSCDQDWSALLSDGQVRLRLTLWSDEKNKLFNDLDKFDV